MPRCGGCGSSCTCVLQGSDAIGVTGTGQANNPLVPALTVSEDVGNSLEVRDDGAYVGAEIVSGLFAEGGISGDGTAPDPLTLAGQPYLRGSGEFTLNNGSTTNLEGRNGFDTLHHDNDGMSVGDIVEIQTPGIYRLQVLSRWTFAGSSTGQASLGPAGTVDPGLTEGAGSDGRPFEGVSQFSLSFAHEAECGAGETFQWAMTNAMGATATIYYELSARWVAPLPA